MGAQLSVDIPFQRSPLCPICRAFFSGPKKPSTTYTHASSFVSVAESASKGCSFCSWVYAVREHRCVGGERSAETVFHLQVAKDRGGRFGPSLTLYGRDILQGVAISLVPFSAIRKVLQLPPEDQDPFKITRNNQSVKSRNKVLSWFERCDKGHESCKRVRSQTPWLPSRLLVFDLEESEDSRVRVVARDDVPAGSAYVALSHCWGTLPLYTLCDSTYEELKAGIPLSRLPPTFRDSVEVCRWFGLQYLWIDSLCIKQDSIEDWQRESGTMMNVYSNANFTIAAVTAKDSSEGLFRPRNPASVTIPRIQLDWPGTGQGYYCAIDQSLWMSGIDTAHLSRRAWAVQERFLSSRIIFFGQRQIFFECCTMKVCESFPAGVSPRQVMTGPKKLGQNGADPKEVWKSVVDAYSAAQLTKETDKLIAISGIAERMEQIMKDRYVVGLWRRNIEGQLVWSCQAYKDRPSRYRAPTWSWLSINDSSSFVWPKSDDKFLVKVLQTHVEPLEPSHPTGDIKFASLRLRGRMQRAVWAEERQYGFGDFRRYQLVCGGLCSWFSEKDDRGRLFTHVDFISPSKLLGLKAYLLPVTLEMKSQTAGDIRILGLVLVRVPTRENTYERIGRFDGSGVPCLRLLYRGRDESFSDDEHDNEAEDDEVMLARAMAMSVSDEGNDSKLPSQVLSFGKSDPTLELLPSREITIV